MALVKHDKNKLAIARSSENNVNVGTTKKNVKVLDEDTYVQVLCFLTPDLHSTTKCCHISFSLVSLLANIFVLNVVVSVTVY